MDMTDAEARKIIDALDRCISMMDNYSDGADEARALATDARSLMFTKVP